MCWRLRGVSVVCVVLVSCALQGCIAWEIRDELQSVNASLADVQDQLVTTNDLVQRVEERLDLVEATNTKIETLQQRLEILDSIDASLKKLDRHLASLRKTIENIDSTIPFLKFSDDEGSEEGEAGEEGEAVKEGSEGEGAAPGAEGVEAEPDAPSSP